MKLVNNPDHKRAKLLRLTPNREVVFAQLSDRVAILSETLVEQGDTDELHAVDVVKYLHKQLQERLNQ